jgi:hypothetical protein
MHIAVQMVGYHHCTFQNARIWRNWFIRCKSCAIASPIQAMDAQNAWQRFLAPKTCCSSVRGQPRERRTCSAYIIRVQDWITLVTCSLTDMHFVTVFPRIYSRGPLDGIDCCWFTREDYAFCLSSQSPWDLVEGCWPRPSSQRCSIQFLSSLRYWRVWRDKCHGHN